MGARLAARCRRCIDAFAASALVAASWLGTPLWAQGATPAAPPASAASCSRARAASAAWPIVVSTSSGTR
jgi:hypothetical protein